MADTSLIFNILANDKTAGGLNSASGRMAKFKQATSVAAVGILGAAAVMGKQAVSIASDTAESTSKVQTLLGKSSAAAMEFANTSATAFGMSKREALTSVGAMSAVQVAMGKSQAEAAKLSVEYTKLSADLGSFNNASSAEVQEALTASLSGEYEMLKKYGIVVNDVTLSQEAARIGMKKTEATWTSAQKQQLSYNIIMASTKAAQGDFARTQGGLANQSKIMSARMDDLQGKIGAKLLPAVVKVAGAFNSLLDWIEQNQTKAKVLAAVVVTLAGAVVATAVAMRVWAAVTMLVSAAQATWGFLMKANTLGVYAQAAAIRIAWAATKVWAAGQWLLNAAMSANPIGLIVIAIVALIAVVVLIATKTTWFQQLWSKAWGAIKGAVSSAFNWVKSNWPLLLAILTGPVGIAVLTISKHWNAIKAGAKKMKDGLVGIFSNVAGIITAPFEAAIRGLRSAWNSTIGGKGISIPKIDLGFTSIGGGGFSIPYLAKGGNVVGSGMAIVGEKGPELVSLGRGAQVTPLTGRGGGAQKIEVEVVVKSDTGQMLRVIRKEVRTRGGNVQVVLGGAG